jgi:hypothetical protein
MRKKQTRNADGSLRQQNAYGGRFGRHTVIFTSLKQGQQLRCHGRLEAQYCLWLEHDPSVLNYIVLPDPIILETRTRRVSYTADFRVFKACEEEVLVKVVPLLSKVSIRQLDRFNAVQDWCNDQGMHHIVVEAPQIQQLPIIDNLQLLYSRGFLATDRQLIYLREQVRDRCDTFTPRDLISRCPLISLRAIARAVFTRELAADLKKPFSLDTQLKRCAP